MKSNEHLEVTKLLTCIKLDARRLFERIKFRSPEYLFIFSNKRTRDHFERIFDSRFRTISLEKLTLISSETNIFIDEFYNSVEEMNWYLYQTEDMPGTVEERVYSFIKIIETHYQNLNLYIDAECSAKKEDLLEAKEL